MVSMHARRRRGRRAGLTLVELLIALTMLFVGLLGLMATPLAASRGNEDARRMGEALSLSQDRLEALRRTAIGLLVPSTESGLAAGGGLGGPFTRVTTVAVDAAGATHLSVRVSWTSNAGRAHAVTLGTERAP
jgi:Tfp pilus assembly protein PilV